MAFQNIRLTSFIPFMASINSEWVESPKHISDYKLIKLPAGDEFSHQNFTAQAWTPPKKRGPQKAMSEEQLKEMAQKELQKKEAKIVFSDD